ncbi:MAG: hypothetical protein V1831_03265 [Candidatus Woesearchaeota archaeon]
MKIQSLKNGALFVLIPKAIERANRWSKGQQLDLILNKKSGNYELVERDETKV